MKYIKLFESFEGDCVEIPIHQATEKCGLSKFAETFINKIKSEYKYNLDFKI